MPATQRDPVFHVDLYVEPVEKDTNDCSPCERMRVGLLTGHTGRRPDDYILSTQSAIETMPALIDGNPVNNLSSDVQAGV